MYQSNTGVYMFTYNITKHFALRRINFFIKNSDIGAMVLTSVTNIRVKKLVVFPIILSNILHYEGLIISSRTLVLLSQSVDINADNLSEEISGLNYNITKHSALWRIKFFVKNFGIAATEC